MVNYSEAKIYKILNTVDDEIYVGSTTQPLSKRMGKHRMNAKYRATKFYQHMNDIGIHNFYIELIEKFPCNSNEELYTKEGEWIRKIGTLNQLVAGRTKQQYREQNKDKLRKQNQEYKEQNKDKYREQSRQYREQNKDKIREQKQRYREQNKEKLREQNQEYKKQNKDKIREQKQQYREKHSSICTCVCGSRVFKINMCKHIKTDKHKQFIETMGMTLNDHDAYDSDLSTTASDICSNAANFDLSSLD